MLPGTRSELRSDLCTGWKPEAVAAIKVISLKKLRVSAMSLSYKCETALYHQVPSLNLVFKVLRGSFKLFLFSWIETHHLIPSAMMQMKQVSFPAGKCWQDGDNDQRSGKRKYPNSPGYYSVSQRCRNLGVVLGQNLSRDDTYWFSGSILLPPLQKQETRVRSFLSSKIWKLLFTSSSPVG